MHLHLEAMHTWQRFTAVAIGVTALHGAALWAMHSYRAQPNAADKPEALLTRSVEPLMGVDNSVPLAPPLPAVSPQSVATPALKNKSTANTAPPVANAPAPVPLTTARTELLPSTKTQTFSTLAPAGTAAPSNSAGTELSATQTAAIALSAAASPSANSTTGAAQKTAGIAAQEVNLVQPVYTQLTQRLEHSGRVQIAFEVDTDGHTVNARVAQSSGFSTLDTAALDAARKTRYKPALCGVKKVQSKYTRNYAFGVDALPEPPQPLIDCTAP